MDILYLSHCVPNPPDKGEKIRAHYIVRQLAKRYNVHVAAFARTKADIEAARALQSECASVCAVPLGNKVALAYAAIQFAAGRSLMMSYYRHAVMTAYCNDLAERVRLSATVAFSTPMAQYAPERVPLVLDMADVDSEKWYQYAELRKPSFLYAMEAKRLRLAEIQYASLASKTYLATGAEASLLSSFAPGANVATLENGVDLDYFDPHGVTVPQELAARRFAVFVGVMDYYPNVDGACWFAENVVPKIRQHTEFVVAGRNPAPRVQKLQQPGSGVTVTGALPDVRPYLAAASVVVAPLRLARGIQNKVLEALAMGKTVLASPEICKTFGERLPEGVVPCETAGDYAHHIEKRTFGDGEAIRSAAAARFQWDLQGEKLLAALASR